MKPFENEVQIGENKFDTIRVGEQVPPGAVNLAYIFNKELDPSENIQIIDQSADTAEISEQNLIMWSDQNGYLYRGEIVSEDLVSLKSRDLFTRDFALTSNFKSGSEADLNNAYFYKYVLRYKHVDVPNLDTSSVLTPAITVSKENGTLPDNAIYKIVLSKDRELYKRLSDGQFVPMQRWSYNVIIYTNFTSDEENTYLVHYNKAVIVDINGYSVISDQGSEGLEKSYSEIINGISDMLPSDMNLLLVGTPYEDPSKMYTIEESENGYLVKINDNNLKGKPDTRVRQYFWWRIEWNGVKTNWICDYVTNETSTNPKRIYPIYTGVSSLITLMKKYDPFFPDNPTSHPILYVGRASNVNNPLTTGEIITDIVSGDPCSPNEISFCIDLSSNTYVKLYVTTDVWELRAYTTNPDTSTFIIEPPAKACISPIYGNIKLIAKLWQTTRTFTVSATAYASVPKVPSGGFDNKWRMNYYISGTGSGSGVLWSERSSFVYYTSKSGRSSSEYIEGVTYFWVPIEITFTQTIEHDDGAYVQVNGATVFSHSHWNSEGSYDTFTVKFSPGWNCVHWKCYNSGGGPWRLRFGDTWSNRIAAALSSSGKPFYMHNSNPGTDSISKTYSKTCTVYLDDNLNPVDVTDSLSVSSSDFPVDSTLPVFTNYLAASPSDGIVCVNYFYTPTTLMYTYRMADRGYWQTWGESSILKVELDGSSNEESPVDFIDIYTLTSQMQLPKSLSSREYKYLMLFLSCDNDNINLRLYDKKNGKYIMNKQDPTAQISEYGANHIVVYLKDICEPIDDYTQRYNGLSNIILRVWANTYSLTSSFPFALRMNSKRSFYLDTPIVENSSLDNWYLRVHNARFSRSIIMPDQKLPDGSDNPVYTAIINNYPGLAKYVGKTIDIEYSLPEFDRQPFVKYNDQKVIPIIRVVDESAKVLDAYTIQVAHRPICHLQEITVDGSTNKVRDVQTARGIIKLTEAIARNHTPKVSYSYFEEWVPYNGFYDLYDWWQLDLNPAIHHNYLTTELGVPGHKSRSELYVNKSRIKMATNTLLSKPIQVYLYPRTVSVNGIKIPNFLGQLDAYSTIFHTTLITEQDDPLANDPFALRLGRVYIQPNSSLKDMIIIDTRTRGGGLDERVTQSLIDQINPEANYYWDIGYYDGQPYQENGVVLVRLPDSILKQNGGRFTEDEVKSIVKKHLALGVLPEIEFVHYPRKSGISGNITGTINVTHTTDTVTASWTFQFRGEDIFYAPYLLGYLVKIAMKDNSYVQEIFVERTEDSSATNFEAIYTFTGVPYLGIMGYTIEVRPVFQDVIDDDLKLVATIPVIIMAASDSLQADKDIADYVCTGISDQEIINSIIFASLPGSIIRFMAGNYIIDDPIEINKQINIIGSGTNTIFRSNTFLVGSGVFRISEGGGGLISNIKIVAWEDILD